MVRVKAGLAQRSRVSENRSVPYHKMAVVYKGNLIFGEDCLEIPIKGPHASKLM